ncbi:hypothetical protein C1645_826303 [Glomus cerebriforme]|uniref:Uncharacterized protein n=1 Tax=Glomus cerebriforme TaxID=658196 RepID=A0A397SU49_9GLOM|nr:hypothetical protein C1645_826303 [Glomus cerebriforme]
MSDNIEIRLCSECYQISSGWIESTLIKKHILILYLPWWDAHSSCITCDHPLAIKSNYQGQKWCSNCIIIYTGCRYCLTTNIIFGVIDQSQCKKCKKISPTHTNFVKEIDRNASKEIASIRININNHQIINYIDKNSNPLAIYCYIKKLSYFSLTSFISSYPTNFDTLPLIFIPFSQPFKHSKPSNSFKHSKPSYSFKHSKASNSYNDKCQYCGNIYSVTLLTRQKYCKICLLCQEI